ncbi:Serine/threonine-protein kinase ATM [Apostasia shenzhenica]|uniref:Serine/threonine-protein kinase ATM n=1 Tax=Apostasia shenzhenica TaxID=1088818 RepID=A0A2I0AEE5_9ASPA|nr:Serine/threonine-protein kinase ATM [Apostasia shenzhenica]
MLRNPEIAFPSLLSLLLLLLPLLLLPCGLLLRLLPLGSAEPANRGERARGKTERKGERKRSFPLTWRSDTRKKRATRAKAAQRLPLSDFWNNCNLVLSHFGMSQRGTGARVARGREVSIVSFLLSLATSSTNAEIPFFNKETVIRSVQTIVDGFLDIDDRPKHLCVVDKINIFRPDRIFKFLLEIHYQIHSVVHPRHKYHGLSSIEALIRIIGHRACASSSSSYILNIMGQYIGNQRLQDECCTVLSTLLGVFNAESSGKAIDVLGEQLQFWVSKLVACCIPREGKGAIFSSRVIDLLCRLTVDANPLLSDYVKDLEPFPQIDCLKRIKIFHEDLCKAYSAKDHLLMFVRRSPDLPRELMLWSLKSLHKRLLMYEIIPQNRDATHKEHEKYGWNCDPEIVNAVWNLVQLIGSDDNANMMGLLSDFISMVGVGGPYQVVFRLPANSNQMHLRPSCFFVSSKGNKYRADVGLSDEILINLLRLLKKYLRDDSPKTVDITSQTLQGILSTEKGQIALQALGSFERSLLAVHAKGVNLGIVEKLLLDFGKNFSAGTPVAELGKEACGVSATCNCATSQEVGAGLAFRDGLR